MRRSAPRPLSRSPVGLADGGRVAEGHAAGLIVRSGVKAKQTLLSSRQPKRKQAALSAAAALPKPRRFYRRGPRGRRPCGGPNCQVRGKSKTNYMQ